MSDPAQKERLALKATCILLSEVKKVYSTTHQTEDTFLLKVTFIVV